MIMVYTEKLLLPNGTRNIVSNYDLLCKKHHAGDLIWACRFEPSGGSISQATCVRPIKGRFANQLRYDFFDESKLIVYFIPFKLTATGETWDDLAWKKAEPAYKWFYADTKEECKMLFNDLADAAYEKYELLLRNIEKCKFHIT